MKMPRVQGNPCKRGHSGLRYLKASGQAGGCVDCKKINSTARYANHETREYRRSYNRIYRAENRAALLERTHARYAAHRETILKAMREQYAANPEKFRERNRVGWHKYYAANRAKVLAKTAAWKKNNPDKVRAEGAAWYKANAEKVNTASKAWSKVNREKERARCAAWRKDNLETARALSAAWSKANPDKVCAKAMQRRAAKLQRTPAWADLKAIEAIYWIKNRLQKERGAPFDVDHVIPLQGKFVSGLHVADNLQIIPHVPNMRKNNRFNDESKELMDRAHRAARNSLIEI